MNTPTNLRGVLLSEFTPSAIFAALYGQSPDASLQAVEAVITLCAKPALDAQYGTYVAELLANLLKTMNSGKHCLEHADYSLALFLVHGVDVDLTGEGY